MIFILLTILVVGVRAAPSTLTPDSLDLSCYNDEQCKDLHIPELGIRSTCFEKQCLCSKEDGSPVACEPSTQATHNLLGKKCPCTIEFTECVEGHCFCASNFTASLDRRRCLPTHVQVGGICELDIQCQRYSAFSRCASVEGNAAGSQSKCQCLPNYAANSANYCHGLVALDYKCETEMHCKQRIENSNCMNGQCMCNLGYVPNEDNTKCLKVITYMNECIDHAQCQASLGIGGRCYVSLVSDNTNTTDHLHNQSHAMSKIGKCICDSYDFVVASIGAGSKVHHLCENRKAVDDSCRTDADCQDRNSSTDAAASPMTCFLTQCICNVPAGYQRTKDERYCEIPSSQNGNSSESIITKTITSVFKSVFNTSSSSSSISSSVDGGRSIGVVALTLVAVCFTTASSLF